MLPVVWQYFYFNSQTSKLSDENHAIISNVIELNLLVTKTLITLQDRDFPTPVSSADFEEKFIEIYEQSIKRIWKRMADNANLINLKNSLCPLLDQLKVRNCKLIYHGVLNEGLDRLAYFLHNSLVEALNKGAIIFELKNYQEITTNIMVFLLSTQYIEAKLTMQTQEAFASIERVFSIVASVNGILMLSLICYFHVNFIRGIRYQWIMILTLLFHVKPRIMKVNSKLMHFFR